MLVRACIFAWRDYWHEALLSACTVLGLAAVLAPLMVLYGVKFGIVTTMTDRLRNDARNLEISPVRSGYFSAAVLQKLQARSDVAFVLPRTRAIAATMYVAPAAAANDLRRRITVSLEPTAPGDPLLSPSLPPTAWDAPAHDAQAAYGVILSASSARKLQAQVGTDLVGMVERRLQGQEQRATVPLRVQGILPLEIQQQDVIFVPLALLEATEDYRDGRQPRPTDADTLSLLTPERGWRGDPAPSEERLYPSFRLYARQLEDVATLRRDFEQQNIEVYTHAEEIATITKLNTSLTLVFYLVCGAAMLGFIASTGSNALASVRRKERHLALLRLVGYTSPAIMAFPLFQGMLTSVLGTALASALYAGAAYSIDHLFAASLNGAALCTLLPRHFATALGIVLGITLLASLPPAVRAASIEPSEVLRDV